MGRAKDRGLELGHSKFKYLSLNGFSGDRIPFSSSFYRSEAALPPVSRLTCIIPAQPRVCPALQTRVQKGQPQYVLGRHLLSGNILILADRYQPQVAGLLLPNSPLPLHIHPLQVW